jgi:cytochrome c oxidase subunit II
MSDGTLPDQDEARSERLEHRWAAVATAIIALLIVMAVFAGVHQTVLPQSRVETADPRTLHIGGEFIESNLGSAPQPDGSVVVRAIGQQYSFMGS